MKNFKTLATAAALTALPTLALAQDAAPGFDEIGPYIMTTLPFLIVGSVLLEAFFNIPGMGNLLLVAINERDFPVIQTFTAIFAVIFIVSNILTDVLYALVDPRVRLS